MRSKLKRFSAAAKAGAVTAIHSGERYVDVAKRFGTTAISVRRRVNLDKPFTAAVTKRIAAHVDPAKKDVMTAFMDVCLTLNGMTDEEKRRVIKSVAELMR